MLHRCPYLSEIPYCIGHISTLERIEVDDFNESIVNSARKIYTRQQEDFGRDNIELHMRHFDTHSQTLGPCRRCAGSTKLKPKRIPSPDLMSSENKRVRLDRKRKAPAEQKEYMIGWKNKKLREAETG